MKNFQIAFDNRVEHDIDEAVEYYNSKVIGLGNRFYAAVKKLIMLSNQHPIFK